MKSFKMYNKSGTEDKLKKLGYSSSNSKAYGAFIYTMGKIYNLTPASHYWHDLNMPLAEFKGDELIEAITTLEYQSEKVEPNNNYTDALHDVVEKASELLESIPLGYKLNVTIDVVRNV